jgi:hypothetical protein
VTDSSLFKPAVYDREKFAAPWPNHFIDRMGVDPSLVGQFRQAVDDACDERAIQVFLTQAPVLLAHQILGGGHGRWVFAKPRLGSEVIPDFMLCGMDSDGYHWTLVELENPRYPALTQSGEQSAKLTHAIGQVKDWRIWLRKNCGYAQNQLGFVQLDAEFRGIVILGRRRDLNPDHQEHYRELSRDNITVMSYDRLLAVTAGAAKAQIQPVESSQNGESGARIAKAEAGSDSLSDPGEEQGG